jgi:hypothetical protein
MHEVAATRFDSDDTLLSEVLRPYKPHCRYLRSAEVTGAGEPRSGGAVTARCELSIPESCYIDDTGHFNSVEFNISYNQMMYYVIAKSVKERLMTPFSDWTMEKFFERQLGSILITEFSSTFRRPMSARKYYGEIVVTNVVERMGTEKLSPLIIVYTTCRFWDDQGGKCNGTVKFVVAQRAEPADGAA